MTWGQKRGGRAGKAPMPEARWSDLAVAAAAADKPSSGSANPILTGPQAARRSAHKVHTSPELEGRGGGHPFFFACQDKLSVAHLFFLPTHAPGAPLVSPLSLLVHLHRTTGSQTLRQKQPTLGALVTCGRLNLTQGRLKVTLEVEFCLCRGLAAAKCPYLAQSSLSSSQTSNWDHSHCTLTCYTPQGFSGACSMDHIKLSASYGPVLLMLHKICLFLLQQAARCYEYRQLLYQQRSDL